MATLPSSAPAATYRSLPGNAFPKPATVLGKLASSATPLDATAAITVGSLLVRFSRKPEAVPFEDDDDRLPETLGLLHHDLELGEVGARPGWILDLRKDSGIAGVVAVSHVVEVDPRDEPVSVDRREDGVEERAVGRTVPIVVVPVVSGLPREVRPLDVELRPALFGPSVVAGCCDTPADQKPVGQCLRDDAARRGCVRDGGERSMTDRQCGYPRRLVAT